MPNVWTLPLLFMLALTTTLAAQPASATGNYQPGDPQLCLGCHGAAGSKPAAGILATVHGQKGHPDSPMNKQGCQSCHGPSAQHVSTYINGKPAKPSVTFGDQGSPAEVQNQSCLNCHEQSARSHWQGSQHQFAGISCASCHQIHSSPDPVLFKETQKEVCFNCHKDKRAQIHKTSAHPLVENLMTCSSCHNPHGSPAESQLLKASVNETCFQCHAEKRGPFLWEHPPVQENCSNCHQPHGSVHTPMLTSRGPWLCQQCHMAGFHPSTAYSGSGVPPNGAAQQMLSKNCMNCHSQVHGSNHPSGVRLTR
ncbi:DmsE family decaheme c-type cytochrome [Spongiibacter sp.]|uniref:DmsE family decaheme c-type cytochrome n=1 Tax=Spongiibacter sp. TaxID=2024860 RepID=UPI003567FFE5